MKSYPKNKTESNWSHANEYKSTFNLVYSGTLAFKHNPEHIIAIADRMKSYKDVRILVISEELVIDQLKTEVNQKGISNIDFLPFQPYSELSDVMACADVFLALLEDEAGSFSVPSKVLTYHCAGRPILMIGPENNLASKIINENQSGIAVSSEKIDQVIDFLKTQYTDNDTRKKTGNNARIYAEENFKNR